jgi:hypothetical protein
VKYLTDACDTIQNLRYVKMQPLSRARVQTWRARWCGDRATAAFSAKRVDKLVG